VAIAIDQTKLRRITNAILAGKTLERDEARAILEISRHAVDADSAERADEVAALYAIAQRVASDLDIEPRDLSQTQPLRDPMARRAWFRALATRLRSQPARELAFTMAFLILVSDLELTAVEHENLEDLQRALGVGDRRASDLVIQLTEAVTADREASAR
jgi:hypothetical protein